VVSSTNRRLDRLFCILYSLVIGGTFSCVFFMQEPKYCLSSDKLVAFFANVNSVDVEGSNDFICQYNTHVSSVIMSQLH
jgi:hypothetical protein